MRTLLIDNYDSFTYNLFQLLAEVNGREPTVVKNDEASWEELSRLRFDSVVISPGPGRPDREEDFGVCAEAIARCEAPLLGICLGFQGLCWMHGATIAHAPEVMHGRLSTIRHRESPLFAGIPDGYRAVRYHSLCVEEPLPEELEAIAWAADGVLMAAVHRTRPQWGVQFHPESICGEHGRRLLENFHSLAAARGPRPGGFTRRPAAPRKKGPGDRDGGLQVKARRLPLLADAERAFVDLFGAADSAFWLDGAGEAGEARFSFIGDASGPLAATVSYSVERGEVRISRRSGVELRRESIFEYLSRELARLRQPVAELPFDFNCGFVGYFGYELKAECGGARAHRSPLADAAFVFADRLIAFDRLERCTYVLCLSERGGGEEGERWIDEVAARLGSLPPPAPPPGRAPGEDPVELRLARPRRRYLDDVAECRRRLLEGETYEVCLTNRIVAGSRPEPLPLYRTLRHLNPAPYSAFLRLPQVAVLSSSPERFLRVDRAGRVEARPIKGTAPRGASPEEDERLAAALGRSEKDRAENLMITDLLRNDLGRVCEVGSVEVPELMRVESYETVHQLVSAVSGRLRPELDAVDCIRACFPAGSMTGAPKKRTMEIIDELEGEARGVYSGAIGYLGLGGGCDLGVVIRTIVIDEATTTIGVGGGIVMQSEPHAEYRESLLKGWAPMQAIDRRSRLAAEPVGGGR